MADVVGVVFHKGGRVYYFDPASTELARGDQVVVQTMRGTEIGEVVDPPHEIEDKGLPAPLKRVVRKASVKDLEALEANETLRRDAMDACRRLIAEHRLDMKLVDAEIVFGGGKVTFSFYSEERVDFRDLVADLAKVLKMRIELRQIGAREEARMVGGLGPCGRHLCCTLWQGDQEPVSIRMAKEQNLPLNPMKISGLCGRLMCCLKYEQEQYVTFRKEAPSRGTQVQSSEGPGVIVGFQVPKDSLTLRLEDGSYTDVPIDECSCEGGPCRRGTSPAALAAAAAAAERAEAEAAEEAEAATEAEGDDEPSAAAPESARGADGGGAGVAEPSGIAAEGTSAPPRAEVEGGEAEPGARGGAATAGGPAAEASGEGSDASAGGQRSGRSRSRRNRGRRRRPSGGGGGEQAT